MNKLFFNSSIYSKIVTIYSICISSNNNFKTNLIDFDLFHCFCICIIAFLTIHFYHVYSIIYFYKELVPI